MRVRVIVADQTEARFYDLNGVQAHLQAVGGMTDPDAALQVPANAAAASGARSCARTPITESDRSAPTRSAAAEPRPRRDAAMRFARQVAAELDAAHRKEGFDRSVLIAGPAFIGLLRSALTQPVRATLVAEVRKDLLAEAESVVRASLPPETFK